MKGPVSKTGMPVRVSRVRIPPCPCKAREQASGEQDQDRQRLDAQTHSGVRHGSGRTSRSRGFATMPIQVWGAALTAAVLTAGCGAGWHRVENPAPADLTPRQQVEVWSGGSVRQWHVVRVTADSVSGISYLQAITCDSCRRSVPRNAVDSMRLGNPSAGFWKTFGLIVLIPSLIVSAPCVAHGHPNRCWIQN